MNDSARAYNQALIYLTPRARSIMETRKNLDKKGFSPGVIDETISKLTGQGLLNDKNFAALFVESRERFRPKSKFALGYELKQKGISNVIIEEILAGVDDMDAALRTVKAKTNRWENLDASTLKKKMMALLRNRGFSYEISMSAYLAFLNDKGEKYS